MADGNGSLEKILSHPVTLSVFVYMHKKKVAVGVREVQRELHISNPSTAYWHLNKLLGEHIAIQHGDNSYELSEEYKSINKLPLTIRMEYYLFNGKLYPNFLTLTIFSIMIVISLLITVILQLWVYSSFVGLLSILAITFMLLNLMRSVGDPMAEKNKKLTE